MTNTNEGKTANQANAIRRAVVAATAASNSAHESWRALCYELGGSDPLVHQAMLAADDAADSASAVRRLWMAFRRSRGMMRPKGVR